MWEVTEVPRDRSPIELIMNLPAPSMMMGMLDQHHMAAFAVAESIGLVREQLVLTRCLNPASL
jgi:hypothetical protein